MSVGPTRETWSAYEAQVQRPEKEASRFSALSHLLEWCTTTLHNKYQKHATHSAHWGLRHRSVYIEKRSISKINDNNNYNINDRLINWLFVYRQNPPPWGSSGHIVTDGEYKGVILHGLRWDPKSFIQYTFASTYILRYLYIIADESARVKQAVQAYIW